MLLHPCSPCVHRALVRLVDRVAALKVMDFWLRPREPASKPIGLRNRKCGFESRSVVLLFAARRVALFPLRSSLRFLSRCSATTAFTHHEAHQALGGRGTGGRTDWVALKAARRAVACLRYSSIIFGMFFMFCAIVACLCGRCSQDESTSGQRWNKCTHLQRQLMMSSQSNVN